LQQRHRHGEIIRFLSAAETQVSTGKTIDVVLDNHATHKRPKVLGLAGAPPALDLSLLPTSASWLNAVENFCFKITRQRIRRGVFRSIADLQAAINPYLAERNASPTPVVWTQSTGAIPVKLACCPVLPV
jgi:hypothetical protein